MKKSVLIIFLVLAFSCFVFACTGPKEEPKPEKPLKERLAAENGIEEIMKKGVLKVGFDTFVPWAMKDKAGRFTGFEIDVATRLAKDMGVAVEFVPTEWNGIIPALLSGKFDVVIGGMGITPERGLKVNFTIPYDYTGMGIVASKTKAPGLTSLEAFNKPEISIAVRQGTTAEKAARKYFPNASIKAFADEAPAVQEVIDGRVHALVASAPLPAQQALKNPDRLYLPVKGSFTREPIGFALKKGDPDALNYFDNWIRVAEAEGWLAERKHYWFETSEWEASLK